MVSGVCHKGLPAVLNGPDIIREYSVENSSFSRFGCGVRVVMRPVHPVVDINGFENFDYNLQFFFRGRELIVIKDSLNLVDHIADGGHFLFLLTRFAWYGGLQGCNIYWQNGGSYSRNQQGH
jgi:hypothetical protein